MVSRTSGRAGLVLVLLALALGIAGSLVTGLPRWSWIAIAGVALALLTGGGLLLFGSLRLDYVRRSGLPGHAVVESVAQAGYGVVDHNRGGVRATYKLVLRVNLPGRPAYQARLTETVAGARARQLRPRTTLAVRADPRRPTRVALDWDRQTAAMMGSLGALGLSIPGIVLPGAPAGTPPPPTITPSLLPPVDPYLVPVSVPPAPPPMPEIPYTGTESPEALLAEVRRIGLPGVATLDAVVPAGVAADGRQNFVLGMWILAGLDHPLRIDNAPTAVAAHLAHKVVLHAQVPVRVASVGGTQATVLLWELL